MVGQIALVGGDEFRLGCEDMDMTILGAAGVERPRVLIVPTAPAEQNPSKAAANGVSYFSGLGADASPLMVLGADTANDERFVSRLDEADLIYLTGGDPDHLLDTLRGSPLLGRLRGALARGAIVAGSSAGAMVMGSWIRYRGWKTSLGVLEGVAVLPHHERSDPDKVVRQLEESAPSGIAVLGIDAKTCCFGGSDGWKVLGPGAVILYYHGRWLRFERGEAVPLETSLTV